MSESGVSPQSQASGPHSPETYKKGRGGRKVQFPSLEEKKQRNRDSQAAFRSRRKSHISELEAIVQAQKEKLQASSAVQAKAKEEVLVLKYKNSLLERILVECGIDVNAELNDILGEDPRGSEKSQRKEGERKRLRQARQEPSTTTRPKEGPAVIVPQKATTRCCHCSNSMGQLTPESRAGTPPTATEATVAHHDKTHEHSSKRKRDDSSDVGEPQKRQGTSTHRRRSDNANFKPGVYNQLGKYSP